MRKIMGAATLATMLCLVNFAGDAMAQTAARSGSGKIVIVFKDGHRQSFNLAEIERVEFPLAGSTASEASPSLPTRGHFLGKWEVGDGTGSNFFITLKENGEAWRSLHARPGRWAYVEGEARITWDDGWQDAIRRVGSGFQKFAYSSGKSFNDTPDNVTNARNLTPHGS